MEASEEGDRWICVNSGDDIKFDFNLNEYSKDDKWEDYAGTATQPIVYVMRKFIFQMCYVV